MLAFRSLDPFDELRSDLIGFDGRSDQREGEIYWTMVVVDYWRRGTVRLATKTCTVSPFWFKGVVRPLTSPWLGRDFDCLTSRTSLSTRSSSPGRTGSVQRNSSKPAPMIPPAGLRSLSTISLIVNAAVYPPLATNPRKIVSRAASSSRWKGCGSNSAANVLIRSLSTRTRPEPKVRPTAKSSRYRLVIAAFSSSSQSCRGRCWPSRLPTGGPSCGSLAGRRCSASAALNRLAHRREETGHSPAIALHDRRKLRALGERHTHTVDADVGDLVAPIAYREPPINFNRWSLRTNNLAGHHHAGGVGPGNIYPGA